MYRDVSLVSDTGFCSTGLVGVTGLVGPGWSGVFVGSGVAVGSAVVVGSGVVGSGVAVGCGVVGVGVGWVSSPITEAGCPPREVIAALIESR